MTDKCTDCGNELTPFEQTTASLHKGQPMAGMCGACKFKYTEEKHGTAQAELDQIRAKARQRNWRFMEKKKSEGGRQLSAIVTKECYDTLTRIRDNAQQAGNPQSFGAIIEKALTVYTSETTNVCSNDRINKAEIIKAPAPPIESKPETPDKAMVDQGKESAKLIQEVQTEIPGPMPNRSDREAYGKWLVDEIDRLKDSGMGWVKITDKFNTEGIVGVSGKTFGRGAVQRFHKLEIKRQAERQKKMKFLDQI